MKRPNDLSLALFIFAFGVLISLDIGVPCSTLVRERWSVFDLHCCLYRCSHWTGQTFLGLYARPTVSRMSIFVFFAHSHLSFLYFFPMFIRLVRLVGTPVCHIPPCVNHGPSEGILCVLGAHAVLGGIMSTNDVVHQFNNVCLSCAGLCILGKWIANSFVCEALIADFKSYPSVSLGVKMWIRGRAV